MIRFPLPRVHNVFQIRCRTSRAHRAREIGSNPHLFLNLDFTLHDHDHIKTHEHRVSRNERVGTGGARVRRRRARLKTPLRREQHLISPHHPPAPSTQEGSRGCVCVGLWVCACAHMQRTPHPPVRAVFSSSSSRRPTCPSYPLPAHRAWTVCMYMTRLPFEQDIFATGFF